MACGSPAPSAPAPSPHVDTSLPKPAIEPHARIQLDGRSFPDHVLALTWDDGPDVNTLALADYLASLRVSATFFVVSEWAHGVSEEPGQGLHQFETGYSYIPILGDLVALGHRLGNHTLNHLLLANAKADLVDYELRENQKRLDPLLTNELRLFRAPGGAWDMGADAAILHDTALADLVGPVRWDIDRKDWEGSLYCRSEEPTTECEPTTPGREPRVRAEVTAMRYLHTIDEVGHGIVLFHDRVGDVGSDYALRVAKRVVPELLARGYVFAPPVLAFSPFRSRLADDLTVDWVGSLDPASLALVDVDGDGRADLCGTGTGGFACARSIARRGSDEDGRPTTVFAWSASWSKHEEESSATARRASVLKGDLNGDGRADECHAAEDGLRCALASRHGLLSDSVWLPRGRADGTPWLTGRLLLADVNGDGRADLCAVANADVACAMAP